MADERRRPGMKRTRSVEEIRRARAKGIELKNPPRAAKQLGRSSTAVLLGDDDPSTWDDEELLHGRRRDKNGKFAGRDPEVIPRAVYDETLRRSMRRADRSLRSMQQMALDQLQAIINGTDVEDKDRLKAIEMVLNRTLGRVPEKIEVSATQQPWEDLVVGAIVDVPDEELIEATAVEADA